MYGKSMSGDDAGISTEIPRNTENLIIFDEIDGHTASSGRLLRTAGKDGRSHLFIGLGSLLAGVLAIFFLELDPLIEAFRSLKFFYVFAALFWAIFSFILGAIGLACLTRRRWAIRIQDRPIFHITILSQLASNLFSFGGLTGASMRARLLAGPERYWPESIVCAVLFTVALNGTSLAMTATAALILLFEMPRFLPIFDIGSVAAQSFAVLFPILFTVVFVIFIRFKKSTLSKWARGFAEKIGKRLQVENLGNETNKLIESALEDKNSLLLAALVSMGDWFAVSLVLSCSFAAVGCPLPYDELIACFGIGGLAMLLSFIPAGIGVLEASLAGVAAEVYGVPLESAVVAIVLYRVIYYGTPIPLSLIKNR
jgi:uncharacterized protein (TIRG00374 family)